MFDVSCLSDASDIDIRLSGGEGEWGYLELGMRGEWMPVCGNMWNWHDAQVACRELGFSTNSTFDMCELFKCLLII